MRFSELFEARWWDDEPTIVLYHGTSSALVDQIREHGLQPPAQDLRAYGLEVLRSLLPESEWTPELLNKIETGATGRLGRSTEENGSVIYTFTTPECVKGYAASYAQHGGEIASDIYDCVMQHLLPNDLTIAEFKQIVRDNPPIRPRFPDAKPIVVEVCVPKSWCIFLQPPEAFKARLTAAWEQRLSWAVKGNATVEDLYDDMLENREVRIKRSVPPEMVRSITAV